MPVSTTYVGHGEDDKNEDNLPRDGSESMTGTLDMDGNSIIFPSVISTGFGTIDLPNNIIQTGGKDWVVDDTSNGLELARFLEGGNVEIPSGTFYVQNGSLIVRGNNVPISPDKEYSIEKNGTDGSGVINFKT